MVGVTTRFEWGSGDLGAVPAIPELVVRDQGDDEPTARQLGDRRAALAERELRAPSWSKDASWTADLEYVWRVGVAGDIASLGARARRLRHAAALMLDVDEHGSTRWGFAPGVRDRSTTRRALRAFSSERMPSERRIVVGGAHGCASRDGRRVELLIAADWADNRARSAAMSRVDIVATCRGRWRKVGCGCGVTELLVGCEQTTLCDWCRRRHWRRWRRRLVRAMGPQLRAARDEWYRAGRVGSCPGVYLITLTAPHSGDLRADRVALGDAWRAVSKRASYGGYLKDGNTVEAKWWGHHAMVYEATPGTLGDGHMHMHAAVISQWVPYDELRASWSSALGVELAIIDVVSPARAREKAKQRGRKLNDVSNAAEYLAKYVTKGVEPRDMTGRKAGELLLAFRGRRKVTTSRHFWRPIAERRGCTECGESHRLVEPPCGLQRHAPAAVLLAAAERSRWKPRPVQELLRW